MSHVQEAIAHLAKVAITNFEDAYRLVEIIEDLQDMKERYGRYGETI